jgi:hypothetical protein
MGQDDTRSLLFLDVCGRWYRSIDSYLYGEGERYLDAPHCPNSVTHNHTLGVSWNAWIRSSRPVLHACNRHDTVNSTQYNYNTITHFLSYSRMTAD